MKASDMNVLLLGKLLAEVYRIQRKLEMPCAAKESTIYALGNGFESIILEHIESIGFVSDTQFTHVLDVLNSIWSDPVKLAAFKGFYDIEEDLKKGGVDRSTAITVLKYLNANGQFHEMIIKMNSLNSPSECKAFELSEWDV